MRSIWKFPIVNPQNFVMVEMPVAAEIMTAATQDNWPALWAMVDPSVKEMEVRKIAVVGTGHGKPDDMATSAWRYLGTCHNVAGAGLVFHLFEVLR